ncbi:MAG: gfo/Idh/MocA family oxidoreductase, partial [Pseudomonadota bacterium]
RVYGERGGLEWRQENPNELWFTPLGEPKRLLTRAGAGSSAVAARVSRIPAGHPEGYLEGFATLYSEVAKAIEAQRSGVSLDPDIAFPTVADGVKGVAFIEAAVRMGRG